MLDMYSIFIVSPVRKIGQGNGWRVAIGEAVETFENKEYPIARRVDLSTQFLVDFLSPTEYFVTCFKKARNLIRQEGLPRDTHYPFTGKRQLRVPTKR